MELGFRWKRIGISGRTGYNFGKAGDILTDYFYKFSMWFAFHSPIYQEGSGTAKLWIGEQLVELAGNQYWNKTYIFSDEKTFRN